MSRPTHIKTLETKYARLKGYYFHIEREAEDYDGAELIDKQNEIFRRQQKIAERMTAIEKTIQIWEPDWLGEEIRPIRVVRKSPVREHQSKLINEYIWNSNGPFTSTDVVEYLDEKFAERGVVPLSRINLYNGVISTLRRREGDILDLVGSDPLTWNLSSTYAD